MPKIVGVGKEGTPADGPAAVCVAVTGEDMQADKE
jgi:hypothetical protein